MNPGINEIAKLFSAAGAVKMLAKPLAENDNTKQQIYLGNSFEVLKELPAGEITAHDSTKRANFKAKLDLYWMSDDGDFVNAPGAQLILYPDYPEVRLSGFLRDCPVAPSKHMQPIPKANRGPKNQWDGRVLFLGTTDDGKILAYLAIRGSIAAEQFNELKMREEVSRLPRSDVLYIVPSVEMKKHGALAEEDLIRELTRIHLLGWNDGIRLNKHGIKLPYNAPNAGGYTLEALLGVIPNGNAKPDFLGWEIKGYSGNRITLMTPEPDLGVYGLQGAEVFLGNYGYDRPDGTRYFTGTHKVNKKHTRTGQTLTLSGFDPASSKIVDVAGGIHLLDAKGDLAAGWSFATLIEHWSDKHSQAAYIKYESQGAGKKQYRYLSPVHLGVGTDFSLCLQEMYSGHVVYDPATKREPANGGQGPRIKARSQFRINRKRLENLYDAFYERSLIP